MRDLAGLYEFFRPLQPTTRKTKKIITKNKNPTRVFHSNKENETKKKKIKLNRNEGPEQYTGNGFPNFIILYNSIDVRDTSAVQKNNRRHYRGHSARHINQLALTLIPQLQQLYYICYRLGVVELTLCGSQTYCIRVWIAIMGTLSHAYTHSQCICMRYNNIWRGVGGEFFFSVCLLYRCIGLIVYDMGLQPFSLMANGGLFASVGDMFHKSCIIIDFTVYV